MAKEIQYQIKKILVSIGGVIASTTLRIQSGKTWFNISFYSDNTYCIFEKFGEQELIDKIIYQLMVDCEISD